MAHSVEFLHYIRLQRCLPGDGARVNSGLQGAGQTTVPMVVAILTQIVILLGICQGFVTFSILTASRVWLAILICHFGRLIFTYAVFRTDGWANKRIEMAH